MVSELENMYKKYKKYKKNQGVSGVNLKDCLFLTFLAVIIYGDTRRSYVEIEFGKNSETYMRIKENPIPLCRADPLAHVHIEK